MNALYVLRKNSGLTLDQVAKLLGYRSPQTVGNWERGYSIPSKVNPEVIKILAKIYNTSEEQILESLPKSPPKILAEGLSAEEDITNLIQKLSNYPGTIKLGQLIKLISVLKKFDTELPSKIIHDMLTRLS
jgi:transcriptional regulator with XRE-family HTH domain